MKEGDIRPQEILDRYLELSRQDAVRCFALAHGERLELNMCAIFASLKVAPQLATVDGKN